ncbi:MAG: hypothetical protein JW782_05995 [Candidatus Saganbacteria bacterium]|nr:hypothetical protein [Candidatus Saganbacteria bacterium]
MSLNSAALVVTTLASLGLGLFVLLKGREKQPNIALALFSVSLSLWCLGQFMGDLFEAKDLVLFWTRLGLVGAVFLPVFFLHFSLAQVGRLAREKGLLYLVYALGLVLLAFDLTPLFVADVVPVLSYRYYPQAGPVYSFFALFIVACFTYGLARLVQAYARSVGRTRNQLLYVLVACLVGFSGGVTAFFPVWGIDFPVLSNYALPLYLLITVYAIIKHRLLDISLFIREGLLYSFLTLMFAGFYVLVVLAVNQFMSSYVSVPAWLTMILVVFISVLVFQPVKDRLQRLLDRIFFMGETRYQKTINDLSLENQQLLRSLLRADKLASLGTLSAGMAHEIKNPLASIKAMTQVLDENLEDREFIVKYQAMMERQIDRINGIVEKLLKFGRPGRLSLSQVEVNGLIRETLALFSSQMEKKGVTLSLDLPGRIVILVDPDQLTQVIVNLVLNAIEAMPCGGGLNIATRADADGLEIRVSDGGTGIEPDTIESIFDPFYTSKADGTGMGLAVAYRSVKEHGGDIRVESRPGKGATFIIWLPTKRGE